MKDYTTTLLGLENVSINFINEVSDSIYINITTSPRNTSCPRCKAITARVHDYRIQKVKDVPFRNKKLYLLLKKRRYLCPCCGKRFMEKYSFLPRYHHMTQRVYENILHELRECCSYKSVAQRFNVSSNTVTRVFDLVNYNLYKLPNTIAIDEFKGNAEGYKYQTIVTNPVTHKVLDILPDRSLNSLIDYFKGFKGRENVKLFVSDMYSPYLTLAKTYFPNAKVVVDKFHYVRQVYWALDRVRKRIQKAFGKEKRLYFKHSKKLLFAQYKNLNDENKQALRVMLSQHKDLQDAWTLKELFTEFRECLDPQIGKKILRSWILTAQDINLFEFKDCITAFTNWFTYIANSLDSACTNAFTEGKNNKIKVLKRNAYGIKNFIRFRNRILHCCA